MTSETESEPVNPYKVRNFTDSDTTFYHYDETGGDEDDIAQTEQRNESENRSVLQSTPLNGPPPCRESHLPSAIKNLPLDDFGNLESKALPKTQQRKSIFSRLSSIAEKSFNSPRRVKPTSATVEEEVTTGLAIDENNNAMGNSDSHSQTPPKDKHKLREPQCECSSCEKAVALDTFSDRASEISCSLASLPQSPRPIRDSFEKNEIFEDDDDTKASSVSQEKSPEEKNTRISDGVHRLSKLLHSTVKAGRKSFSKHSSRSGLDSETSSNTIGAQSCQTFQGDETKSNKEHAFLSKCLRKLASAVSIHNYGYDTKSTLTDDGGGIDGDHSSISNNSLMFVLLPPKPDDVQFDQLIFGNGGEEGSKSKTRDPALRKVLEEIRGIMLSQEVVVKQASKALDECSNLVWKQSDSIIFAEQLLNVASQSYFLAESELHRLVDGGIFEPQRDRVVLEKIALELPDFKSPAPQSFFLVLLKSGHRIKSSKLICLTPRQQCITVENWNRHTGDRSQTTECIFEFNRPDWKVNIEVYFVCKQRRESLVSLDRFARLMDTRSPPSRRLGSNRSVEVRKSSFGLLAQGTFSKEDILNQRAIFLSSSHGYGPFQSQIKIEGRAFLHSTVSYEAYLIVKDFNGRFGSEGQMRTFSARLSNQRLDFFERYDDSEENAEPIKTILLYDIPEKNVEVNSDDCNYFYDFTLKLCGAKESWLHLCTNSREDTDKWVEHFRLALREPCGIDLHSLSPKSNTAQIRTQTAAH